MNAALSAEHKFLGQFFSFYEVLRRYHLFDFVFCCYRIRHTKCDLMICEAVGWKEPILPNAAI